MQPTIESTESQPASENIGICGNHEECKGRSAQIKLTKGFVAKEPVKGHMASSFFQNLKQIVSLKKMESWEIIDR